MSTIITTEAAREHLRLGDDVTEGELDALIAAAEAAIGDFLGRPLIDPVLGWATAAAVPANVVHAIKLALAGLYDDREAALGDMTAIRNLCGRYQRLSIG